MSSSSRSRSPHQLSYRSCSRQTSGRSFWKARCAKNFVTPRSPTMTSTPGPTRSEIEVCGVSLSARSGTAASGATIQRGA
eukprot:2674877-Pyramimonas_sp.AAC.1